MSTARSNASNATEYYLYEDLIDIRTDEGTTSTENGKGDLDMVRCIELLPGVFDDDIECRMHCNYIRHVSSGETWTAWFDSQSSPPEFEALSYVWGTSPSTGQIYMDGKALHIRSNLVTILRYLRHKMHSRRLWIDAICINQENLAEKNVQVQRMSQIYRHASAVLVWLGESSIRSELAFDTIEALGGREDEMVPKPRRSNWDTGEHEMLRPTNKDCLKAPSDLSTAEIDAIHHLFTEYPWWSRMWIVQEITYPPLARLICGHRSIHWDSLESMFSRGDVEQALLSAPFAAPIQSLVYLRFQGQLHQALGHFESPYINLASLAWRNMDRAASEPRDMIFALLGLSSCPQSVTVDYSKPVRDVFTQATQAMILDAGKDTTPSLNIVCTAYRSKWPSRYGLPSWVPDFSCLPDTGRNFIHVIDHCCTTPDGVACFNAAGDGGILVSMPTFDDRGTLSISALDLDELLIVNSPLLGDIDEHWDHSTWEPDEIDNQTYPYTGEPAIDAFWRTLVQDQGSWAGKRLESEWSSTFRKEYLYWSGRKNLPWEAQMERFQNGQHKRHNGVFDRLHDALRGYTFSVSRQGYYAIVPSIAKPGDHILVAKGLSVPVIVRQQKGNSIHGEVFTLVGPAYVHGVMDGETAEDIAGGTKFERLIHII